MVDYVKMLHPIGCNEFGCVHCGRTLKHVDLALDCADCAAIFCEDCVKDGTFATHKCEDYDYEDDYEVE